jgi:DNA-binding NtrC family response regulator
MAAQQVVLMVENETDEPAALSHVLRSERYAVHLADNSQRAAVYARQVVDLLLGDRSADTFDEERIVLLCRGGMLTLDAVPTESTVPPASSSALANASTSVDATVAENRPGTAGRKPATAVSLVIPPGTSLAALERAAIEQALALHSGNRTRAAQDLGISVRTLQRKLKAWGKS